MKELINQLVLGLGAIFMAPFDLLPQPALRITLPPQNALQGIVFDFSRISSDFNRVMDAEEKKHQMELKLELEHNQA